MLSEEENKEKSLLKTELRCLGFNFQLHVNFTDGKFFEAFQWPYGNFTLVTWLSMGILFMVTSFDYLRQQELR